MIAVFCIKNKLIVLKICSRKRDGIPLATAIAVGQNRLSNIYIKGDTIAMDYYASYKNSKDPSLLRKELVSYALKYGNKKAAQYFQTTVKTVRKWRKRWQEKKGAGLKDRSKKPEKSPRMMKMYWQFKIKALAEKATADNRPVR